MFPYLLFQLHDETAKVISKVLDGYPGNNSTVEQAWDFIQRSVSLSHTHGPMTTIIKDINGYNFGFSCSNSHLPNKLKPYFTVVLHYLHCQKNNVLYRIASRGRHTLLPLTIINLTELLMSSYSEAEQKYLRRG